MLLRFENAKWIQGYTYTGRTLHPLVSTFSNIKYLYLGELREPKNLNFLSCFPKLEVLILSKCRFNDISGLLNCRNLKRLGFQNCTGKPINSIILAGMVQLTTLAIANTPVTNYTFLSNLTRLNILEISDTDNFDDAQLRRISRHTNISYLNISQNPITDISIISNLTNLQQLAIHRTQITNLSPILNFTNLKALKIIEIPVTDISCVRELPNLQNLYVSENMEIEGQPVINDPDHGIYVCE